MSCKDIKKNIYETIENKSKLALHNGNINIAQILLSMINNNTANGSIIVSSKNNQVQVNIVGSGSVELNGIKYELPLNEPVQCEESILTISDANNITELDLSNNELDGFYIAHASSLVKLVLNDNNLKELDCSGAPNLQFLHIINNPMCRSTKLMQLCVDSLHSRKDRAMGSIIFYPWYGLETLIERIEDKYYKYPYLPDVPGNVSHKTDGVFDNPNKDFAYDSDGNYKFYEGKLYATVSKDNNDKEFIDKYHIYLNGKLLEHKELNDYNKIRKNIETTLLLKNFVVGSGIMYSDEWKDIPLEFKLSNIADIWETSEKGFGIQVAIPDEHSGRSILEKVDDEYVYEANIVSYLNADSNACEIYKLDGKPLSPCKSTHTEWLTADTYTHGDLCASHAIGRGKTNVYGFCPNSKVILVQRYSENMSSYTDYNDTMVTRWFSNAHKVFNGGTPLISDIVSISFTMGNKPNAKKVLDEMVKTTLVFASTGNEGDDLEYTTENISKIWNKDTYLVSALQLDKSFAPFPSAHSDFESGKGNNKYLTHFGSSMTGLDSPTHTVVSWCGTSASCPACASHMSLLKSLYNKISSIYNLPTDNMSFMDYVGNHWIDPLLDLADNAVGIGIPFTMSNIYEQLNGNERKYIDNTTSIKIGMTLNNTSCYQYEPIKFGYLNLDVFKPGIGIKNNISWDYIVSRNNYVYPTKSGIQEIETYSKSGLANPVITNTYSKNVTIDVASQSVPMEYKQHSNYSVRVDEVDDTQYVPDIDSTNVDSKYTIFYTTENIEAPVRYTYCTTFDDGDKTILDFSKYQLASSLETFGSTPSASLLPQFVPGDNLYFIDDNDEAVFFGEVTHAPYFGYPEPFIDKSGNTKTRYKICIDIIKHEELPHNSVDGGTPVICLTKSWIGGAYDDEYLGFKLLSYKAGDCEMKLGYILRHSDSDYYFSVQPASHSHPEFLPHQTERISRGGSTPMIPIRYSGDKRILLDNIELCIVADISKLDFYANGEYLGQSYNFYNKLCLLKDISIPTKRCVSGSVDIVNRCLTPEEVVEHTIYRKFHK